MWYGAAYSARTVQRVMDGLLQLAPGQDRVPTQIEGSQGSFLLICCVRAVEL